MKFTLPKNAIPVVEVSPEQQAAFIEEADTVVREIVTANEAFISEGASLNAEHWALVRSKEGIQVYRQRKKSINQRGTESCSPVIQSPSWSKAHAYSRYHTGSSSNVEITDRQTVLSRSSGVAEDSIMEKMRPHGVSLMALHGTMDGDLDDCMFGCCAPNDEAWKLRSSHINDRLDDARILASIRGPTNTDPCRFLGVKWFAKEMPAVLTGIVSQRDFLVMESSGFTQDSKGERVGYFLMHSVTLRAVPEFSHLDIVRGVMSFCYLFRQGKPGKVDTFCRGFFDSRGDLPGRMSVSLAADSAICCASVVDYGYIRKLRWLMQYASKHRNREENRPNRCETCDKSFAKFSLSLSSSGSGSACQICHQVVCAKCNVTKKITMHVSDTGSVQQCSLSFCLGCLLKAKQLSSWNMALSSLEASSRSSGSSSSTPAPPTPPDVHQKRGNRAYSVHAGTRAYQQREITTRTFRPGLPSELNRSTSDQTNVVANERVRSWSPRSTEPKSARGVRFA